MVGVLVQESRLRGFMRSRRSLAKPFHEAFSVAVREELRVKGTLEVISSHRKQIRHHSAFDPLKQSNML